jgi:hypothetical protein
VQTLKGTLMTYLPDQTFKDAQSNGRPKTRSLGDGTRDTDNPSRDFDSDEEELSRDFDSDEGENLQTDDTNEEVPISDPEPQPALAPEAPESDGEIDVFAGLSDDEQIAGVNIESQLMDREA